MDDLKIYVLKEYDDELAYGEETLQVFADKAKAMEKLKKDFCKWAGIDEADWGKAPQLLHAGMDDTFSGDYVSMFDSGKGSCQFFVVEEMNLGPSDRRKLFDEMQAQYDREDARQLLEEMMEDNDIELSTEEQETIISESAAWYRNNYDWTSSGYDQLEACVNKELEKRNLIKSKTKGMNFYG